MKPFEPPTFQHPFRAASQSSKAARRSAGRDARVKEDSQTRNGNASSDGLASFVQVAIFRNNDRGDFSSDTRIITTATRLSANPNLLVFRDLGTSEFSRCRSYTPQALAPELFANGFE
ncbi:MAG: hypothetical protein R3F04_14515 [Lysobacteraceae bacterium]